MTSLVLSILNRSTEALQSNEQAIALSQRPQAASERLVMLGNSAVYLGRQGQLRPALQRAQQALELATDLGEDTTANGLNARLIVGHLGAAHGQFAQGVAHLEQCLEQLETLKLPRWLATTRNHLAWVWACMGQPARALRLLNLPDPDLTPAQAVRRWTVRNDLHRLCGTDAPAPWPGALPAGTDTAVAAMARLAQARSLGPAERVAACQALDTELEAQTMPGMALYARVVGLGALAALQDPSLASAALTLLNDLRERLPNTAYWPETLWTVHRALVVAGEASAAHEALNLAWRWVMHSHETQVPQALRDSFLRRNAINTALQRAWHTHQTSHGRL